MSLLRKFRALFRGSKLDAEIEEEMRFHLEMREKKNAETGMPPAEARFDARRRFGNTTLLKERTRYIDLPVFFETVLQDVRFGVRALIRNRAVTIIAVLSLALGIGANTAIFTLINAIMLQSLPVRDPGKLVLFYSGISTGVYKGGTPQADEFSYPFWQHLKAHNDSFVGLCAFREGIDRVMMHLSGASKSGPEEQASVHLVSGNYFDVLGVGTAAGRVLSPRDDTVSAPRTAVISYRYWRERFHRNNSAIGKTVLLNGTSFTIVGVAAREFFGERVQTPPDYWIPLSFQPQILQSESWLNARNVYWLNYMGRLKPGRTIHSANTEVNLRLHQFYTAQAGTHLAPATRQKIQNAHVNLKPGGTGISGLRFLYSQPLHILMAVVGLVLLIACANIAILLLARASARQQELLARIALGASRRRLIRQLLTESVLLSIIGGAVGVVVAYWCVKGLVLLLQVSSAVKVQPDWSVLAFTIGISILTGIAFGIIPAIRYSGIDPRGATAVRPPEFGKSRFGSASALIVLQVALSLILLIGAGMLAHSLLALETQNLGFHQNRTLVVSTSPRLAGYQPKQLYPLYREMDQRLNALPGVVSAALAQYTPVSGTSSSSNFSMEGYTPAPGKEMNLFGLAVGPRFFETLGIPVLSGRTIGPRDIPATPAVAVVNETFVKQYLPHRNPIGQHIYLGSQFKSPGVEIVGVVADSKYYDLRKNPEPMVFSAVWQGKQFAIYAGNLIIRTQGDPASVIPEVKQMLNSIDSRLPILDITTLDRQIANSLKEQKMITTLCSIFGILALVLASIGIYGTMAYSVARRTTEIGIRMALGAQRGQVLWMILRDSVLLISAGLVVGFPLALAGTHWIRSFLFGVPAADPVAIGSAVVLIAILAMVAGYLPARRASRIDPMSAIRYE